MKESSERNFLIYLLSQIALHFRISSLLVARGNRYFVYIKYGVVLVYIGLSAHATDL